MEGAGPPRTVDSVFNDFMNRRDGLIKALTTDVDEFYANCDPEKARHPPPRPLARPAEARARRRRTCACTATRMAPGR